jgi:hypothetical protein
VSWIFLHPLQRRLNERGLLLGHKTAAVIAALLQSDNYRHGQATLLQSLLLLFLRGELERDRDLVFLGTSASAILEKIKIIFMCIKKIRDKNHGVANELSHKLAKF